MNKRNNEILNNLKEYFQNEIDKGWHKFFYDEEMMWDEKCIDCINAIDDLQQELQRKDNNWNELKEFILNHYIVGHKVQNSSLDMIINKMKELENEKK